MSSIDVFIIPEKVTYDGTQLRPRWAFEAWEKEGSTIALFKGPCDVPTNHMVDIEDRKEQNFIFAQEMVHLIGELYEWPTSKTILLQHLVLSWIRELIEEKTNASMHRRGNDLFVTLKTKQPQKLSVSIAAAANGSSLFHIGINNNATGAPVAAIGLEDLDYPVDIFMNDLQEIVIRELRHLHRSVSKSLPLH